jgi:hypothetical protein
MLVLSIRRTWHDLGRLRGLIVRKNSIVAFAVAPGGLLAASSAAKVGTLSYTFAEIDVQGSIITSPIGMSNIGQIVGTHINDAGNRHGFLETGWHKRFGSDRRDRTAFFTTIDDKQGLV